MSRTTEDDVKAVLLRDYDSVNEPSLAPFIAAAGAMTDQVSQYATDNSITVSSATLTIVETWLAAHFYSCTDRPYEQQRNQGAWGKFQGKTGMALDSSHYGQTAMALDPTGELRKMGKGVTVGAWWLGKRVSDQIPYEDRD